MRSTQLARIITVALLAGATGVAAQEADTQEHDGVWIGLGLGAGWNTSRTFDIPTDVGMAFVGRFGITPSQRWLLGFEVAAWIDAQISQAITRTNSNITAMFYPSQSGGLYLKGGLGVSTVQFVTLAGDAVKASGFGSTWGIGWDLRVGSNLYITPNVDYMIQVAEAGSTTTKNTILLLTVGLIWH